MPTPTERDRAPIVADIRNTMAQTVLPQGYSAHLNSYRAYEEAAIRIGLLSLVSLALIFVVLQRRYRSGCWRSSSWAAFPLALVAAGCALARWLTFVGRKHDGVRNACRIIPAMAS